MRTTQASQQSTSDTSPAVSGSIHSNSDKESLKARQYGSERQLDSRSPTLQTSPSGNSANWERRASSSKDVQDSPQLYSSRRIIHSPMQGGESVRKRQAEMSSGKEQQNSTPERMTSPEIMASSSTIRRPVDDRRTSSGSGGISSRNRRSSRASSEQEPATHRRQLYQGQGNASAPEFIRRSSTASDLSTSNSRRPLLVPKSALRTDADCFGLDFSFLDDEPPSKPNYTDAVDRRGSMEQARANRSRSGSASSRRVSRDISRSAGDFGEAEDQHLIPVLPSQSSTRSASSGSILPFPTRPKAFRAAHSTDSYMTRNGHDQVSRATQAASLKSHAHHLAAVGSDRRPSTVSSLSIESTGSSVQSTGLSFISRSDIESPTSSTFSVGVQDLSTPSLDHDKRKRLATFLDQTAAAMEGGRSLGMVLSGICESDMSKVKSMSEIAEAVEARPSPRPPQQGDTSASLSLTAVTAAHDATLVQDRSPHLTPVVDQAAAKHDMLQPVSSDPHKSVYATPDASYACSSPSGSDTRSEGHSTICAGGLGFNIDIKTESDLSSAPAVSRAALTATESSPTVRASSPAGSTLTTGASVLKLAQDSEAKQAQTAEKRKRTIQELIETEVAYATDMAVVRDIYLARARGTSISIIADRVMASGLGLSSSAKSPTQPMRSSKPTLTHSTTDEDLATLSRLDPRRKATETRRVTAPPSLSSKLEQRRANLVAKMPAAPSAQALMSNQDLHIIFANLEDVTAFAEMFATVLARADGKGDDRADKIGQAFCEMAHRLEKIYSTYCTRHDRAISRLSELESQLKMYFVECRTLSHGRTTAWDLGSLLIKPVQRILKYPLLLDQILTMTPEDHPDRAALQRANDRVLGIAEHINEQKKRNRHSAGARTKDFNARRESTRSLSSTVTKKFLRSAAPKVPKSATQQLSSERDDMFDSLAHLVDSTRSAVLRLSNEMRDWSKSTKASLEAQVTMVDAWMEAYGHLAHDTGDTLYSRLGLFLDEVLDPIIDESWREVDHEIRRSLLLKTDHLLSLFESPRQFIARRNDKMLEHHRYLAKKLPVDRRGSEEFIDLSNRLLDELPRFLGSVTRYYDIITEHFADVQDAYQEAVQEFWERYTDHFAAENRRRSGPLQHSINDMMSRLAAGLGVPVARERSIMAFPPARRRSRASGTMSVSTTFSSPTSDRRASATPEDRRGSRSSVHFAPGTANSRTYRLSSGAGSGTGRSSIISDTSTPSFTTSAASSSGGGPRTPPQVQTIAGEFLQTPPKGYRQSQAYLPATFGINGRYEQPLPSVPVHDLSPTEVDARLGVHWPGSTGQASQSMTSGMPGSCDESTTSGVESMSRRIGDSTSPGDTSDTSISSVNGGVDAAHSSLHPYRVYVKAADTFEYSDDAETGAAAGGLDNSTETETEGEYDDIGEAKLYTAEAMHSSGPATNPPSYRSGFPLLTFKAGDRIDVEIEEADRAEGGAGWLLGRKHDALGVPTSPLGWARTEFFALVEEEAWE